MAEDRLSLEVRIIVGGIRVLTILTFAAFFGWAVYHLYKMFVP